MNKFIYYLIGTFVFLGMVALYFLLPDSSDGLSLAVDPITALAVGSAIVSGVANAWSSSASNESNQLINKRQREWQTKENEKQRAFQQYMFDQTNAYNTPVNQMKRLKDAGLNPFLNQTQVGSVASDPGAPSVGSAPSQIPNQPINFSGFGEIGTLLAQASSVDAQNELARAQVSKTLIESASGVLRDLGPEAAEKFVKEMYPLLSGTNFNDSPAKKSMDATIRSLNSKAYLDEENAWITYKYGSKQAQAIINDFDRAFTQTAAQIGLWANLAKRNEWMSHREAKLLASEIARNSAAALADTNVARLYKANAMTAEDIKKAVVDQAKAQAMIQGYAADEAGATFDSRSYVRDYLSSPKGKDNTFQNWTRQNDAWLNLYREILAMPATYFAPAAAPFMK